MDTDDLNCADLMWAIMWLAKGGEERINEDENVDCEDRHRHRLPMIQLLTHLLLETEEPDQERGESERIELDLDPSMLTRLELHRSAVLLESTEESRLEIIVDLPLLGFVSFHPERIELWI